MPKWKCRILQEDRGQYDTSKSEKLAASFAKIAEEAIEKAGKTLREPGNINCISSLDANGDIPSLVLPVDDVHGSTDSAYSPPSPFPAASYVSTMDDAEQTGMSFLQNLNWPQHLSFDPESLSIANSQGTERWASRPTQHDQGANGTQYNSDTAMMDDFMNRAGDQAERQHLNMYFDWLFD